MRLILKMARDWFPSLQSRHPLLLLLIYFVLLVLLALPFVGGFLPFTYLAL